MTYADMQSSNNLAETGALRRTVSRPMRQRRRARGLETIEVRLLVALTYPLFLAVAILSRLGLRRPGFGAVFSALPRSLFAEAWETAEATIQSAFRG